MHKTIEHIIKNKIPCYFVSPHYDDAALSAGGLITDLAKHTKVTVITVFTKGDKVNTFSAKKALQNFKTDTADTLYQLRAKENSDAFNSISVPTIDLNYTEALWRKIEKPNLFSKIGSKLLPEFAHIYPTYKFHIQTGKVSGRDMHTVGSIASDLKALISEDAVVFCPEGIGGHVDHVATKLAVEKVFSPIYWADQPYSHRTNTKFGTRYKHMNASKNKLISFYKTQIEPMFGTNTIPHLPESFSGKKNYIPEAIQGYAFSKMLSIQKNGSYEYALYTDKNGKEVFAKILRKKFGNAYKFMMNEIKAYKLLESERIENGTVCLPQLLGTYEDNAVVIMLLENITGQQLASVDQATKKKAIEDVLSFMQNLSEIQNKFGIFTRDMKYWLGILPFVTATALLKHPESSVLVLRAFLYVIWRMRAMLREKRLVFSHRDIGNWNIVINKGKTYIFDLQLASFAPVPLDYATAALKFGAEKYASKKVISLAKKHNHNMHAFNGLGIILALYDLSMPDGGDAKISLSFIKNALSNNFYAMVSEWFSETAMTIQLAFKSPINFLYSFTLSKEQKVFIHKYNPESRIVARRYMKKIQSVAPGLKIHFIGSASLEIDGLADIDLLIECSASKLEYYTKRLAKVIGQPNKKRSEFSEWEFTKKGFDIEISLMDPQNDKFLERINGYQKLKNDRELLSEYEILKRSLNGKSLRSYTRKRMIFFKDISA